MIDILKEQLLNLKEAAKKQPCRRMGKPTNVSTVFRWGTKGLRGYILETVMVGGIRMTSVQALDRFFRDVTAAKPSARAATPTEDVVVNAGLRANGLIDGVK